MSRRVAGEEGGPVDAEPAGPPVKRRRYQRPCLRKKWGVEWIGLLTIIGWLITIGFSLAILQDRAEGERLELQRHRTMEALRQFQTITQPEE